MSQPRPLSATRNRRPLRPAMWIATLVMVLMHGPLAAAVFQVTSATDSGPGSLRAAIELANATAGNHVIEFAPSTDGQPIVLASPLPPLLGNGSTLTFQGNGAAQTIITLRLVLDSVDNLRFFKNPLDGHEGSQRAIGILLHITNLRAVGLHFAAPQRIQALTLKKDIALCRTMQRQNRFHQA